MESRELWVLDVQVIVDARTLRGWSRLQLARKAGVSPHTVAKIEKGGAVFPQTAACLGEALGIPVESLRGDSRKDRPLPKAERTLASIARRHLEIYSAAAIQNDLDVLKKDFCAELHPEVVWTSSSATPMPFDGVYRGQAGVESFLGSAIAITRRAKPFRVETVAPIDQQRIALVVSDTVTMPEAKVSIHATGVILFTFGPHSRDRRVRAVHQSIDTVELRPLPELQ